MKILGHGTLGGGTGIGSGGTPQTQIWNAETNYNHVPASNAGITTNSDFRNTVKPMYGVKYKQTRTAWAASAAISLYAIRIPATETGFSYQCIQAGITGSVAPVWPLVVGNTVTDGTVVWRCIKRYDYGIVKNITATLITLIGSRLETGQTITELYFCRNLPDNIEVVNMEISDFAFLQADTDVIRKYGHTISPYGIIGGNVVGYSVWAIGVDGRATKAAILAGVGSSYFIEGTSGISLSAANTIYDSSINLYQANSYIENKAQLSIDIPQPGTLKTTYGAVIELYIILND